MSASPTVAESGNEEVPPFSVANARVTWLIVNADDFGLCDGVNLGVARAHDHGIVTSASLMVRGDAAAAAVAMAAERPALSLGLHVDLGEWVWGADGWAERYRVVDIDDAGAVAQECRRQLDDFVALVGRPPTHLDGHQHIHRSGNAADAARRLAAELRVPLRLHDPLVSYRGEFYGHDHRGAPYPEGISPLSLVDVIESLPPGWFELGCHPGVAVDTAITAYAAERDVEVDSMCRPAVRRMIEARGIHLVSFADFLVHAARDR